VVGGHEVWCREEWEDVMGPVRRKGPGRGRGFEGRTGMVSGRGDMVMLFPVLPASFESMDERFPCPADTKAIFPVHVVWV
jgi:hypothetical protein